MSSLIAQGTEFPLKKPAGFHWDLFLLGLTTGVAGLLGLPFPNGLIPQAPFHTDSLCVTEAVPSAKSSNSNSPDDSEDNNNSNNNPSLTVTFRAVHVVEQRVSNLAQGLLTLVAMTGPLLGVLHLVPQGVLAGLFFIMGFQALAGNGITRRLLFLLRDAALTDATHPLRRRKGRGAVVRRRAVWLFVVAELVGFGATFAVTQTVAAVGFPVFILLLIPVRALLLPRWLKPEELAVLDEPTASLFTMESVGGTFGGAADAREGLVVDERGQELGGETERSRETKRSGSDLGDGGNGVLLAGRSDDELAELGESRSQAVRRRLSILHREDGAA